MQIRNARSPGTPPTPDELDGLLDCRIAMLGLDPLAIEGGASETLAEIMRRCTCCGDREACAVDLKRDPNNPVWETYCPNAKTLLGLAEASWQTR